MRKLPKNCPKSIFNYLLFKVTTIVNIIIYYLFYSYSILHLFLIAQLKEQTDNTFHYDYTLYDYM